MNGRATRRGVLASLPAALAGAAFAETGAAGSAVQRVLDPRAFGAKGDGASDDTPAFRAMHRAMRRLQDRAGATEFVVRLSPGHYRYDWNRWTWGLRRVTVTGYGAAIQCMHRGPFDVDQAPLLGNRDHYWTWDPAGPAYGPPSPTAVEDYGWRIRTARPGDEAVQAFTPVPVRPGEWVLIQSYAQQQDGYPPNMRHFERARVLGTGNNVVRLDRPLRHLHRDDWPEDPRRPAAIGRARLVPIDRPDCPLALSQRFVGFTVLSNPNHASRDPNVRRTREVLGLSGALRADVRDCTLIALGVSQCGEVSVENTTIQYTEPDKLVDKLILRGCTIDEIQQCTGVNQLTLEGCTIGTRAQLLARNVVVRDCTFLAPEGLNLDGAAPTHRMAITDSRFSGAVARGTVWTRLRIDGRDLRLLSDGRVAASGGSRAHATLVGLLEDGWPVVAFDGDGPRFGWCAGTVGQGGDAVFAFALSRPLRMGDVLAIPRLLNLSVQGCQSAQPVAAYPDPPALTWEREVTQACRGGPRSVRFEWRSGFASRPAWTPGYPRRLRCLVTEPYTGPDEPCLLRLRQEWPGAPDVLEFMINLRIPGEREVSVSGVRLGEGDTFRTGGQAASRLPASRYVGVIVAETVTGAAAAPAAGTTTEQASFTLEFEIEDPFAGAPFMTRQAALP